MRWQPAREGRPASETEAGRPTDLVWALCCGLSTRTVKGAGREEVLETVRLAREPILRRLSA